MDYFTRYGLEFNPFIKDSKEILIDTTEYKETLFRLDYLAKTKGFGILTGSAGRGKTTAVRSWAASLNHHFIKLYIHHYQLLHRMISTEILLKSWGMNPHIKSRITSV